MSAFCQALPTSNFMPIVFELLAHFPQYFCSSAKIHVYSETTDRRQLQHPPKLSQDTKGGMFIPVLSPPIIQLTMIYIIMFSFVSTILPRRSVSAFCNTPARLRLRPHLSSNQHVGASMQTSQSSHIFDRAVSSTRLYGSDVNHGSNITAISDAKVDVATIETNSNEEEEDTTKQEKAWQQNPRARWSTRKHRKQQMKREFEQQSGGLDWEQFDFGERLVHRLFYITY